MIKFKSFEDVCKSSKGQSFDYQVTDYIYNSDTKLLCVSPNKRDIFEEINSYADSSLNAILDKYSSISEVDNSGPVLSRENYDLNTIAEAFSRAEEYRESRNLSSDLDYKQIFDIMLKESHELENKLKKGGVTDEKKAQNEPKSE